MNADGWISVPEFEYSLCDACGKCIIACPEQALTTTENGRPGIKDRVVCSYCGVCEKVCPTGAISLGYEIVLG